MQRPLKRRFELKLGDASILTLVALLTRPLNPEDRKQRLYQNTGYTYSKILFFWIIRRIDLDLKASGCSVSNRLLT